MDAHLYSGFGSFLVAFTPLMEQEDAISALKVVVDAVKLAENDSNVAPAKAVFDPISTLVTMIRVCFLLSCNDLPQVHT